VFTTARYWTPSWARWIQVAVFWVPCSLWRCTW